MDYQHAPLPAGLDRAALAAAVEGVNARFAPEVRLEPGADPGVWTISCRWLAPGGPSLWIAASEGELTWPTAADPLLGTWLLDSVSTALAVALGAVETWHDCTGEDARWALDFTRRWPGYSAWESRPAGAAPGWAFRLLMRCGRALDRQRREYAAFFDRLPPWEARFVLPPPASPAPPAGEAAPRR